MRDSYGREINYARISVTDLCNLRCAYCMPTEGVNKKQHSSILRLEEIIMIAKTLISLGINKIRLTGGEPLIRNGILYLVEELGRLEGLTDLAMTTNGILLSQYARQLKEFGLNQVNISLDTLDSEKYKKLTANGTLDHALKGIKAAVDAGLKVKLNTVLVNGFNTGEIVDFVNLTKDNDFDVRFIELMPVGSQSSWALEKYMDAKAVTEAVPSLMPVSQDQQESASPAVYYRLSGAKGRVGLIRAVSCKFCDKCNKIRITADGKIKSCLHSDFEMDIKSIIGDKNLLRQAIIDAVQLKPYEHELEQGEFIKRDMPGIGG